MADVVLDANVLVGLLDDHDVLASRSIAMLAQLRTAGARPVLLDICVGEAISVICRRSRERKFNPPDLARALARIRSAEEGLGNPMAIRREQNVAASTQWAPPAKLTDRPRTQSR